MPDFKTAGVLVYRGGVVVQRGRVLLIDEDGHVVNRRAWCHGEELFTCDTVHFSWHVVRVEVRRALKHNAPRAPRMAGGGRGY